MYKLGFFYHFSSNVFDDEIFTAYFESCNAVPIWVEIIDWGEYDYETDNGTGFMATVCY